MTERFRVPLVSKDKAPGRASKQPRLLFAQGQLLQTPRPQDFQKGQKKEGRTTLLTRCCLPQTASCRRWKGR